MDWETSKRLVLARSWGMCEGCGKFGKHLDPHHRQARGAGGVHGAAAEVANDVRNLLALCRPGCHDDTENANTWDLSEGLGWRIPHFVEDPLVIPALIHTVNGYAWWFLTDTNGYRWADSRPTRRLSFSRHGADWTDPTSFSTHIDLWSATSGS
jgi:hypothetical protein